MATTFVMGLAVVLLSRHRQELRRMLASTERAVLLPTLLFAGASVNLTELSKVWMLVVVALALRVLLRVLTGPLLARLAGASFGTGLIFGVGLLPSGAVTIAMGLAFSLRFPGRVGDSVLICAALVTLLGELVGTAALRRALKREGAFQT
jgi:Kef-type K+ transport system membrane component KefB